MSEQGDLLQMIIESREQAIHQVETNANPDWKDAAYSTGVDLAKSQEYFTSEEVLLNMVRGIETHEPRAMGPVMRRLQKDGVIEATSRFITSISPLGHGRPSRVWKSLMVSGSHE